MSSRWPKIRYRDFHDRPRAFVVEWRGSTYFFDAPFLESADDYSSTYSITRLLEATDLDLSGSWGALAHRGTTVGLVPVHSVEFDTTLRESVNPEVFDRIGLQD